MTTIRPEDLTSRFQQATYTEYEREALRDRKRAQAARTRWHVLLALYGAVSAAGAVLLAIQLTSTTPVPVLVGVGMLAAAVLPVALINHHYDNEE